ncbi:MAG: hypothetical protein OXP75_06785 [Rhodospirillales bacterium]|nr:hypothetical protein [Rhodospirillales bacterium]
MSSVQIVGDHAEVVSRKLAQVWQARVARKAVTAAGSAARKDLPALIAEVYSTSKGAVGARGKAPSPGAELDAIAYRLTMNRRIRIAKLRASARKFRRRRKDPLGLLRVVQPQESGERGADYFRAAKGDQPGVFRLPRRGSRPARRVGGVPVSLRKNPVITRRIDRIGEDLSRALVAEMEKALKGRGR